MSSVTAILGDSYSTNPLRERSLNGAAQGIAADQSHYGSLETYYSSDGKPPFQPMRYKPAAQVAAQNIPAK